MNLIELHILQSFPVTCMNRDDVGAPKSAIFGGSQRARVSSQSWKRAIRQMAKQEQNDMFGGQRTRYLLRVLRQEMEAKVSQREDAELLALALAEALGKIDNPEKGIVKTLLYFSPLEIESVIESFLSDRDLPAFLEKARTVHIKEGIQKAADLSKAAEKAAKNLAKAVKDMADIAFFGRMVADDHSLMVEGAGLFSHALSTHTVSNEIDFFSAVDDLKQDEQGAGYIGTLEFNAACYYRYIGLNLDMLRDEHHLAHFNDAELIQAVKVFLKSAIMAVPEARKNSMFGFNPPEYILGLRRSGQPLSLANAFEKPIKSTNGYLEQSIEALKMHWDKLQKLYHLDTTLSAKIELPPNDVEKFTSILLEEK